MITSKIQEYFDRASVDRDRRFSRCPILGYEQHVRQKAVMEMLDLEEEDRILDLGCGNGRDILLFIEADAEYVGIDLSRGMIAEASKKFPLGKMRKIHFVLCDGTNLPFRNGSFNKSSCSAVIEHIQNYEDCIKEMTSPPKGW